MWGTYSPNLPLDLSGWVSPVRILSFNIRDLGVGDFFFFLSWRLFKFSVFNSAIFKQKSFADNFEIIVSYKVFS